VHKEIRKSPAFYFLSVVSIFVTEEDEQHDEVSEVYARDEITI